MNQELKNAELRIPKNIDAEKSIISCLLQNNQLIDEVMSVMSYEMFYDPIYRAMYRSICELSNKGSKVDMITLKEQVTPKADGDFVNEKVVDVNSSTLDKIEFIRARVKEQGFDITRLNDDFFLDIIKHAVLTTNVLDYCKIVRDKYILRNAISACERLILDSRLGEKEPEKILMETQDVLFELAKKHDTTSYYPIDKGVMTVLKEIEDSSKTIDGITGVKTGFKMFDARTYGFQKQNLIILGARPAVGKTAFALNLAHNIAKFPNQRVLMFSLEMSRNELLRRAISMESGLSGDQLRRGNLRDDQWIELVNGVKKINGTYIYIDEDPYLTISDFRNKVRKFHKEIDSNKVKDIVMIDYMQIMHAGEILKNGTSKVINSVTDEISVVSRNLKAIAKELDIPILALVQLNRDLEHRHTKKAEAVPQLSDIKGSGSIEQDADVVMLMHNHKNDPAVTEIEKDITDIIFAKNRSGETGIVKFRFNGGLMKFEEHIIDFQY